MKAASEYSMGMKLKVFRACEVNGNRKPKKGGRTDSYMAISKEAAVGHLLYTLKLRDKTAQVVEKGRLKGAVKAKDGVWAFV